MAGIKTSISLQDGVSPALLKMTAALENLENVLKSVDVAFRNCYDSKSIEAARDKVASQVELTKLQKSQIEKLNNQILASERARNKLEEERASYSNILIQRKSRISNLEKEINSTLTLQGKARADIDYRQHKLLGLEKAIEAAKNDEEVSAYQIQSLELLRNKWVAEIARNEARIVNYDKQIKGLKYDIGEAELMIENAQKRKAVITQELKSHLTDELHLRNRIEAIENKAAKDQADLANKQAAQVQKALDGVKRIEEANIASVKRQEAVKREAWDKQQAQMGKAIVKAEELERKERRRNFAINNNTKAQERFNSTLRKGVSTADALTSKIKSMVGAYLGVQTAGSLIKTSDQLAANEARLGLMVKDGESVTELEDKIYAAAMRSRSGYLAMSDSISKVGIQAGNLFGSSDEMVRFMETFNKMAVISKSTTQQTNAAMNQLIQALSFGQLRGDELKSILENMPMVAQVIADEATRMGDSFFNTLPDKLKHIAKDAKVTAEEIRELGYEGQISAETVVNAMLNGAKKIDKMAENMTWTWGQVWQVFKNSALKAFTPILKGITAIIQTERFKRFATWIDHVMVRVSRACVRLWNVGGVALAKVFDVVANIGTFIKDKFSFIAPILWGVIAAFTAYKTILVATAIWQGICTAATTALTAAKVIGVFVTRGITAVTARFAKVQLGLNAAMYACPYTWVIASIIAIIVLIYLVVAAINYCADTSISATGIICGAFTLLGIHIWNTIAYLWNAVASFAEFFVNVWTEPMYSVKKLFVNLATNVIDCLIAMTKGCDQFATSFANAILWAVNKAIDGWNAFVDILPDSVSSALGLGKGGKIEARSSITSDLESFKSGLNDLVADKPADYWEAPRMKNIGSDAVSNAYNWGNNLSKKVEGVFDSGKVKKVTDALEKGDFAKALSGGFADPNSALNKIAGDTGDIAKNTGDTAKNTEKSDEDFKYLRQLAERDSMNRSQLMNFKVDMSNVNHIKSGLDVDEVMKRLAKELYYEVISKMEGVY